MVTSAQTDTTNDNAGDVQSAPSTSRFIEAGGLRLHYLDYGTAGRPPMICLHGGGAHAHWFDFVAADFNPNYHVLSLDQRGCGDSAWSDPPDYSYERFAADLAEVVEKLDLRDFVLVGHSMGGVVSLVYAANYPGRLGKLVVVDSNLRMKPEFMQQLREQGMRKISSYATLEELAARYRLRPEGTAATPERIRYLGRHAGRQVAGGGWQHKFDRRVYAQRKFTDALACWNRVSVPALLVRGMLSQRITPEIFKEVQERCPQVELAEVANSHHHVMVDNPAGFVEAVRPFLVKHA